MATTHLLAYTQDNRRRDEKECERYKHPHPGARLGCRSALGCFFIGYLISVM
jgi:hypothetical protein